MSAPEVTLLLRHARELLTMAGPAPRASEPFEQAPLGLVEDAAVAIAGDRVVALGHTATVEAAISLARGARVVDLRGEHLVAPGLVDAHTHALFVGHRADEYLLRLQGAGYEAIARAGGGIARSVRQLREADDEALDEALGARLARMAASGVTTVEVKTGYGLDTPSELRSLRCLARVAASAPVRVVRTHLPLHAVDPTLRPRPDGRAAFLERTLRETLPAALALEPEARPHFVDAYLDGPGFSVREARPVLEAARAAGVPLRLHVGQFEDVGGAELAAELGAASADHLEALSDAGARAMARAGVVGVLLPGAAHTLGQTPPDARRLRALGLELAVATDCNPGTSYAESLPLCAALAVRTMGLSPVELWWGITRAAARSLRRDDLGALYVGGPADLCVLPLESWAALPYRFGGPTAALSVCRGRVFEAAASSLG